MTSGSSEVEHPVRVLFYTGARCQLCERAAAILERLEQEGLVRVEPINISDDPRLVRDYGSLIPVVVLEGSASFAGRISEFRLRRALATPHEPS